jgi:anti-sigma B factor antagonist
MDEAPLLSVTTERHAGGATIYLEGELDLSTADELRAALDATRPSAGVFVIDLAGLEFMDSSGIHLLVSERAAAAANAYELVIAGANGEVREAMQVCGVDGLVGLAPDFGAAPTGP